MFDIHITDEQRRAAADLVSRCNFGNRGTFDGNRERQYTGILGQIVMADGVGLPRPTGTGGFDDGIDFTVADRKVDLKTMGRTVPVHRSFVNNLVASQTKYQTEVYVFASINKTTRIMTVCGVYPKSELGKWYHAKGDTRTRADGSTFALEADMYEIPNLALRDVRDWTGVVWAIAAL